MIDPKKFLQLTQNNSADAAQYLFDNASIGQAIQAHPNPDGSFRLDWSRSGITPQNMIGVIVGGWIHFELLQIANQKVSKLGQEVDVKKLQQQVADYQKTLQDIADDSDTQSEWDYVLHGRDAIGNAKDILAKYSK